MHPHHFLFWQKWLTFANAVALCVGLLTAFAGNSFVFSLHNAGTRHLFFGGADIAGEMLHLKNWLFGIIGGTIAGFHVLMIAISENAFKNRERWAYWAMWYALMSWFVIDSGLSAWYGAYYNIYLVNLPALFLIGLPLWMTRREFVS